jgi:hypothetical protein
MNEETVCEFVCEFVCVSILNKKTLMIIDIHIVYAVM